MRREALAMSGILRTDAIAEQLDAAAGAGALDLRGLELAARPNCSATVVVKGYTVDEPTMLMESRADCACAVLLRAQTMLAASEEIRILRVTV